MAAAGGAGLFHHPVLAGLMGSTFSPVTHKAIIKTIGTKASPVTSAILKKGSQSIKNIIENKERR